MITIVRFTNTKTIYTVVTDCHSRVIASILVGQSCPLYESSPPSPVAHAKACVWWYL